MESEELKALSFVRRALLRKNDKLRQLTREISSLKSENEALKAYQWKCADLEEENKALHGEIQFYKENISVGPDNKMFVDDALGDHQNDFSVDDNEPEDPGIKPEFIETGKIPKNDFQTIDDGGEDYDAEELLDAEVQNSEQSSSNSSFVRNFDTVLGHDAPDSQAMFTDQSQNSVESSAVEEGTSSTAVPSGGASLADLLAQQTFDVNQGGQEQVCRPGGGLMCPVCGRLLTRRAHLVEHLRTHTGEKPFQCPHCKFRCAKKSNLKQHCVNLHYNGVTVLSSAAPPHDLDMSST